MNSSVQFALPVQEGTTGPAQHSFAWDRTRHCYSGILLLIFFFTLPLVNPWVRGDGVGYYAYIRSLLVEHQLDFTSDWRSANDSFTMGRIRPDGSIDPLQFMRTGHLDNHFAVGPSMLWAPFLIPVHGVMLTLNKLGFQVQANGYTRPYIVTMALATALYGFLGLFLSFRWVSLYADERWAFLATLGIWFASSLPVYMYFNPSWAHAHAVFAVAVFLWYWQRTRPGRTLQQWLILGLISGVVLDVYYANIALLLVPFAESLAGYWRAWRAPGRDRETLVQLLVGNLFFSLTTVIAFIPTLITRQIIYGNPLDLGYPGQWGGKAAPLQVLFSSDHGLFTWTPVLIPAVAGLYLLRKRDKELALYLGISFLAFYALISTYACWDGISSFGNRFFISLTPLFILGLAITFNELARWLGRERRAVAIAGSVTALLILWNLAFIFQWGTHLVPARGPISWKQMVHNQFVAVPQLAATEFAAYFENRRALMNRIEQDDMRQLKSQQ